MADYGFRMAVFTFHTFQLTPSATRSMISPVAPSVKTAVLTNPNHKLTYVKKGIGADVQAKIAYVDQINIGLGMTDKQRKLVLGLIDHESAGTWSETIKGDNGCSTGIGQWNACPGSRRQAPKTFNEQAQLICTEMKAKFDEFPDEIAVGKHNAPAWDSNPRYTAKVIKSSKLFNF